MHTLRSYAHTHIYMHIYTYEHTSAQHIHIHCTHLHHEYSQTHIQKVLINVAAHFLIGISSVQIMTQRLNIRLVSN